MTALSTKGKGPIIIKKYHYVPFEDEVNNFIGKWWIMAIPIVGGFIILVISLLVGIR